VSTYVLVHGAWRGSWIWKRVRRLLQAQGHDVFTPTLTGVADRSHLSSPNVSLETHITDIANLIRWEELSDVILCGHSYGGCVVSGVADRVPDRIGALVYLDAFVLENGQCLNDTIPPEVRSERLAEAKEVGEGWKLPPISAEEFNVNLQDRDWVNRQSTMQSLACFEQPLRLTGAANRIKNITYIWASGWSPSPFPQFYDKAKAKGWKSITVESGHDVMLDRPEELTELLLAVSPGNAASAS
jgi:pimeloyl-ACP methyl ester carboxylesterase